jgi:hypothetical protein
MSPRIIRSLVTMATAVVLASVLGAGHASAALGGPMGSGELHTTVSSTGGNDLTLGCTPSSYSINAAVSPGVLVTASGDTAVLPGVWGSAITTACLPGPVEQGQITLNLSFSTLQMASCSLTGTYTRAGLAFNATFPFANISNCSMGRYFGVSVEGTLTGNLVPNLGPNYGFAGVWTIYP